MGIKSAQSLEVTSKSFEVLIGNADRANALFAQLYQYAKATPFEFSEVASAARTLLGYGVSVENVSDRLRRLGDAAGATGGNLDLITRAYAQMVGRGKVTGDNLRQLSENFVNLREELSKVSGVAMPDLDKAVENGQISIEELDAALNMATDAGGRFYKGTDILSKTVSGRMATLKDQVKEFAMNLVGVFINTDPAKGPLGLSVQPGGLFDRFSQMIPRLISFLERLGPVAMQVGSAIAFLSRQVSTVASFFLNAFGTAYRFFATLYNELRPALTGLVIVLQYLWGVMQSQLIPAWNQLMASLAPHAPALMFLAKVIAGAVVLALVGFIIAMVAVGTALSFLMAKFLQFTTMISNAWNATFGRLYPVVAGAMGAVVGAISGGLNAAYSFVVGFASRFFAAGKGLVDAIANGIRSAGGAIIQAIKDAAGAAAKFLPFSDVEKGPFSHLTASGRAIPQTLAQGVYQGMGVLSTAMNSMPGVMTDTGAVAGGVGGVVNNFYPKQLTASDIDMAASRGRFQIGQSLKGGL